MTPDQLIDLVLFYESGILEAISLGARYEGWLQVELGKAIKRLGYDVTLEKQYPGTKRRVDFHFSAHQTEYWVELKVESPSKSRQFGGRRYGSGPNDIDKLQILLTDEFKGEPENLWFLNVGHSESALSAMEEMYGDVPASYLGRGQAIAVAIYSAYYY